MKVFISLFLILCSITVAQAKSRVPFKAYTFVLDEYTGDMPEGLVRVKGFVRNQGGDPLFNSVLGPVGSGVKAKTNRKGAFEFFIAPTDTAVYCFMDGYVEVATSKYNFQPGHTVTIHFFLTEEGVMPSPPEAIIAYKPVIYLYSEEEITASVQLDFPGVLTFTYPRYNKGWQVDVSADGVRDLSSGKMYPYLFWEGELKSLAYQRTDQGELMGQRMRTDTSIAFLERSLTALGLTRKEQTDFITFWGPKLTQHPYAFVQFLVDETYSENVAGLTVSPQPDCVRRVYILFSGADRLEGLPDGQQQKLKKNERFGFTVVEWGGSYLKLNNES